jgi:hypothetical protein
MARRPRSVRLFPVLAAMLAIAGAARANDTEAVLGAGGLTFTKSAALRMQSEDLRLSSREIRVAYVFRNLTDRTVTARLAFPLPDVDVGDMSETPHHFHLSGRDGDIVDFRLTVDGRPTPAALEARAVNRGGRDVTDLLRRYRIPLIGARSEDEVERALDRLTAAEMKALAAAGAVYADEWRTPGDVKHPGWRVKAAYHWLQTFPAHGEVRIEHRYAPVLGGAHFERAADLAKPGALRGEGLWPDEKRGWCLKPAAIRIAPGRAVSAAWLEYILRTGANWAGPIGRFRLEIAADPGGIVATCPVPGLTLWRRGQDLIAERAAFTPTSDLAVLFVSAEPSGRPPGEHHP